MISISEQLLYHGGMRSNERDENERKLSVLFLQWKLRQNCALKEGCL